MNILFLSRLFYPHIGGVEKHVYQLSKQLMKKGHKIIVIAEKHEKKLKNKEVLERIEIYRIPIKNKNWFKKFNLWFWLFKNRTLIEKADIIHCHDVFFWYLPFKLFFPKKKVFTTFHGYESYPLLKKAVIVRKISEILSSGNICVGEFMKKWYHAKPDYVSYGAVERVKPVIKAIKDDSAVFIGRLDEQTGILTYLKAVEILRKKIGNFVFTIVGDGNLKNQIGKEHKLLGFKKEATKYLYRHNFAFVSRYLSILEAMLAKKLIFAVYDNPIKEDYLRMTPFAKWIIIKDDPKELAQKIEYYLKNQKEKDKKINDAYEWVLGQTWNKMSDMYLQLWQK